MPLKSLLCALSNAACFAAGFVNQTIYDSGIGAGWGWRPYLAKNTQLQAAKGSGLNGAGRATCVVASKGGALPFMCRNCTKPGYR